MKKKKILFLTPTLGVGGGERVVSLLSLHFSPSIKTTIVVFENIISYSYKGRLIPLDIPTKKNVFLKLYYLILAWARFKKILRKHRPDAVISLGVMQNIIAPLAAKDAIVRVGNSLSKGYGGLKGRLLKILFPLLWKRAKKIVAISYGLRHDLVSNFSIPQEKIKVIYNPISREKIEKLANEPLEPLYTEIFSHRVIITVGRLGEQKGQWHLINTFKNVRKKELNTKLVIIGEGSFKGRLSEQIDILGLKEDAFLLGWQDNPFKFLARSTLFVLPSLWEGLGNAIIEAMACRLPIISFDCPSGPRDILAPDTHPSFQATTVERAQYGILVPSENEALLEEAIEELIKNEDLRRHYQAQSLNRARDFDIRAIIKKYESLL